MDIPADRIGRFRNVQEAESFRQAQSIQQEVQAIADLFVRSDGTSADLNRARPGQVLLEATSLASISGDPSHYASGSVSFDPRTGQVQELRAKAWHTWAQIGNHPISSDPVSLTRQGDSTTYRSLSGSVTVDGLGNYRFKPA